MDADTDDINDCCGARRTAIRAAKLILDDDLDDEMLTASDEGALLSCVPLLTALERGAVALAGRQGESLRDWLLRIVRALPDAAAAEKIGGFSKTFFVRGGVSPSCGRRRESPLARCVLVLRAPTERLAAVVSDARGGGGDTDMAVLRAVIAGTPELGVRWLVPPGGLLVTGVCVMLYRSTARAPAFLCRQSTIRDQIVVSPAIGHCHADFVTDTSPTSAAQRCIEEGSLSVLSAAPYAGRLALVWSLLLCTTTATTRGKRRTATNPATGDTAEFVRCADSPAGTRGLGIFHLHAIPRQSSDAVAEAINEAARIAGVSCRVHWRHVDA